MIHCCDLSLSVLPWIFLYSLKDVNNHCCLLYFTALILIIHVIFVEKFFKSLSRNFENLWVQPKISTGIVGQSKQYSELIYLVSSKKTFWNVLKQKQDKHLEVRFEKFDTLNKSAPL